MATVNEITQPIVLDHGDQVTLVYLGMEILITASPTGDPLDSFSKDKPRIEVTRVSDGEHHEFEV